MHCVNESKFPSLGWEFGWTSGDQVVRQSVCLSITYDYEMNVNSLDAINIIDGIHS